jgi:hypothetical protein
MGVVNPSSRDIINGFSLDNDDSYNEFQSDASDNDNTAKGPVPWV